MDGDVISVESLREVFGDDCNGTKVQGLIVVADYKNGGIIEYDLFLRALRDLGTVTSRRL